MKTYTGRWLAMALAMGVLVPSYGLAMGSSAKAGSPLTAGDAPASRGDTGASAQIQIKESNGIQYMSGTDAQAMSEAGRGFNLKVTLATKTGDSGSLVRIESKGKTILQARADGPLFFTNLPAGEYNLVAETGGKTVSRTVQVPANGQQEIVLNWPTSGTQAGDAPLPRKLEKPEPVEIMP